MIGYHEDNSGRKYILIETPNSIFSFSILYGMKGKGRKGDYVDELWNSIWRSKIQDINDLDKGEKRICVKEAFNEWYYE